MSKGKKQLLTVIGLLLLLAAMVCAYVFVPKGESDTSDEDGTKDTAANTVEVINIEKDNVSEISITLGAITDGKKQTKIHLKKEGDSWKFADDASIPVDSDQVDSLIGSISPVKASQKIQTADTSLSDYGLEIPEQAVTFTTTDGQTYTFKFGSRITAENMAFMEMMHRCMSLRRHSAISLILRKTA